MATTTATASPVHHSRIAGRALPGVGGERPVVSPATGEPFASVSLLGAEQLDQAFAAAEAAFPAWSGLEVHERTRYLERLRHILVDEARALAELIAREQGKPVAEAHAVEIFPVLESLRHLERHAPDQLREEPLESEVLLLAHKRGRLRYEPYGTVLVISPWNYPLAIPVPAVAAALAAGNVVLLKPAPATTLVALRIAELADAAGLPPGVLSVLALDDALAASLVASPRVGKIVFTGSVPTARKVMAAAAPNVTSLVLELGGKDPAIVLRDADLDRAAQGIVWGAFMNAGQTCASVERLYVEAPVADALTERIVAGARSLRVGDPLDAEVDIGPMTLERQRRIVEEHVADALERGAELLSGGERLPGPGFYYPPTVLARVDHGMRIMREESFGPVLPIQVVDGPEQALQLANDSPYGLTASIWTRDAELASRLERGLRAGVVTLNDLLYSYGDPAVPFGGFKQSGFGRTHGLAGLREMVQVKLVSRDWGRRPMLWWFPYGPELTKLLVHSHVALYGRSLLRRLASQLRLLTFRRFLRRVSLLDVAKNVDRLF
jgi:succinate-semialdehyde dehydrogenase/glutarate-semialdehyde dehydrogenase